MHSSTRRSASVLQSLKTGIRAVSWEATAAWRKFERRDSKEGSMHTGLHKDQKQQERKRKRKSTQKQKHKQKMKVLQQQKEKLQQEQRSSSLSSRWSDLPTTILYSVAEHIRVSFQQTAVSELPSAGIGHLMPVCRNWAKCIGREAGTGQIHIHIMTRPACSLLRHSSSGAHTGIILKDFLIQAKQLATCVTNTSLHFTVNPP